MSVVHVVSVLVAKKGKEEAVKAHLLGLVAPSRRDPGCIAYDLHQDADAPHVFVFYETWESRERLEAHLATPHLAAWKATAPDLLDSREMRVLKKLS